MHPEDRRLFAVLRMVARIVPDGQVGQILNVGAGTCTECNELLDLFPNARLTLVDHSRSCIEALEGSLRHRGDSIQIVHDEAANFLSNNSVTYDLILVRHPDVHQNPSQWQSVFRAVWAHLSTNGALVATFYSYPELQIVKRSLEASTSRSPFLDIDADVPVPLDGRDRYILGYINQVPES